jgi:hypothetical protein
MAQRKEWADVIIAWANGEVIQFKNPTVGRFLDYDDRAGCVPCFNDPETEWRVKPRDIITIGGVDIPAPLTSSTNIHRQEEFYLCDPVAPEYYVAVPWGRVKTHHIYRRLLHTKAGNAIAHTKALIVASGGRVE